MIIQFLLYIDPGIGSLAAQVIIAGIAACAVFFKNSFRRIFKRSKTESNQRDHETQPLSHPKVEQNEKKTD